MKLYLNLFGIALGLFLATLTPPPALSIAAMQALGLLAWAICAFKAISASDGAKFSLIFTGITVLAVLAALPYWRWLGLL